MARRISSDDTHVYRAVVVVDGRVSVYGPYTTAGPAKSMITSVLSSYRNRSKTGTGVVESSPLSWSEV